MTDVTIEKMQMIADRISADFRGISRTDRWIRGGLAVCSSGNVGWDCGPNHTRNYEENA